jgi:hypothetical protein
MTRPPVTYRVNLADLELFADAACKDTGMSGAAMNEAMREFVLKSGEIERLREIEAAARNLVVQKGRHHTQQAYERLAGLVLPNACGEPGLTDTGKD